MVPVYTSLESTGKVGCGIRFRRLFLGLASGLASLCMVGGNLFLLQLAAWSWMLTTYSAEDGLASAIRDTFSGDRPCELCKAISEIKKDHRTPTNQTPPVVEKDSFKLIAAHFKVLSLIPPTPTTESRDPGSPTPSRRALAPDLPPPKA